MEGISLINKSSTTMKGNFKKKIIKFWLINWKSITLWTKKKKLLYNFMKICIWFRQTLHLHDLKSISSSRVYELSLAKLMINISKVFVFLSKFSSILLAFKTILCQKRWSISSNPATIPISYKRSVLIYILESHLVFQVNPKNLLVSQGTTKPLATNYAWYVHTPPKKDSKRSGKN